jgi:hypothetical protein
MLRNQLSDSVVKLILSTTEELGRTRISEDAGINRAELTPVNIRVFKLFRLLRLLVVIAFHLQTESRWKIWWNRLGDIIYSYTSVHQYYTFVDEHKQ